MITRVSQSVPTGRVKLLIVFPLKLNAEGSFAIVTALLTIFAVQEPSGGLVVTCAKLLLMTEVRPEKCFRQRVVKNLYMLQVLVLRYP